MPLNSFGKHWLFLSVILMLLMVILKIFAPAKRAYSTRPDDTIALVGGTVVDGTGNLPVENAVIIISEEKIVAIGTRDRVPIPAHARVINADNTWIIPGLIDAHVHFAQSGDLYTRPDAIDLRSVRPYADEVAWLKKRIPYTMSRYICSGVTSVVDFGGSLWTLDLKKRFRNDKNAPRISACGPLLSTYVPEELTISDPPIIALGTPEQARAHVRQFINQGAELIKIWFLNKGTDALLMSIKATIDEAHAHNTRVVVHATEKAIAQIAIDAGADILAHSVRDEILDSEFIDLLKKKDIIYIPTFQVNEGYHEVLNGQIKLNDIEKSCGDAEVIATWDELPEPQGENLENGAVAKENLRRVANAGIKIAAGSDAGNIGTLHGPALHREMELMVEAGLSPMRVLVAATRDAAFVVDKQPLVGTLESGKLADLVILEGNPLADIRNLSKIKMVIKNGKNAGSH